MAENKKNQYVDNKAFYVAITDFFNARKDDPEYPVSDFLGKCIMEISHRIAFRPNFINYSYRDEMQEDALENCLRYIDRFDPEKSTNPFGYFSRIAWFACIRRIQTEQTQMDAKAGLVQSGMLYQDTIDHNSQEEGEYFDPEAMSSLEFLYTYEIKKTKKKDKPAKPRTEFDVSLFV